ncbi:MAG TPA: D-alanyl-D-alanine carboxypeptidase/D-alanyl-D-alanine-endopeptidase, partial [Phycisphaerales bacterium]|nr:D-alanyl-D-alanine carboxypeptidase/D-alanyl-D-alanine-endopeptidase [Phycisphaerales bacterium]
GQDLSRRVERAIAAADVGASRVGVSVRDVSTGQVLVSRDADSGYIPASNMKLLTTGAAIAVLGPDFVFRTEVAVDGRRVIVRGSGDPALADPEVLRNTEPRMTVEDFLDTITSAVAKKLPGGCDEIIIDDRVFDREFVHPTWDPNDLNKWYAPEVAGLNFHGNLLAIFASPAPEGPGSAARVSFQPQASWIGVSNRTRTVAEGSNTYWPTREPDANRFTLFGDVRTTSPVPQNTPTHNNPLLFGQLLADRLMKRGIPVAGAGAAGVSPPAAVRLAAAGETLPDGQLVAVVTTPIQEVLNRCNTDSINMYAEALLKRIGHEVTREPGSWANGASVIRMVLEERLGSRAAASTIIADGSGLSHSNVVSAGTLTALLEDVATDSRLRDPYLLSLATPGRGTFTRRFRDLELTNQVAGKSGTLTGVRTLSGYVVSDSGRELAFSVLINDVPSSKGPNASKMAERIVGEIDAWLAERAPAEAPAFGG